MMRSNPSVVRWVYIAHVLLPVTGLLMSLGSSGCGTASGPVAVIATAAGSPGAAVATQGQQKPTGTVHGGNNPVSGAVIQLYAVGAAGYGSRRPR